MKNKSLKLFGVVLGLMITIGAESAPLRPKKKATPTTSAPAINIPNVTKGNAAPVKTVIPESVQPWWLIAGLDLGLASYSPFNTATQGTRSGLAIGGRVLIAYYYSELVNEGGLGWQLLNTKGTNPNGTVDAVISRIPYLDFSTRYRFNRKWQLGPELQYWLATDNGLNPDATSLESNKGLFVGLQVAHEINKERKFRFGARWLTALNGNGRNVNLFQGFFEVAFDVFRRRAADSDVVKVYEGVTDYDLRRAEEMHPQEPLPIGTPEPQVTEGSTSFESSPVVVSTPTEPPKERGLPPKAVKVREEGTGVVIILDDNDLPFGSNDANLPKSNSERVKNIGKYLDKHAKVWKHMVLAGHTDERGAADKNMSLSKARAELVRSLLIQGGVSSDKMNSIGYGESRPIDKRHVEAAWAKNRRVELRFRGVTDVKTIKKAKDQ